MVSARRYREFYLCQSGEKKLRSAPVRTVYFIVAILALQIYKLLQNRLCPTNNDRWSIAGIQSRPGNSVRAFHSTSPTARRRHNCPTQNYRRRKPGALFVARKYQTRALPMIDPPFLLVATSQRTPSGPTHESDCDHRVHCGNVIHCP